MLAVEDEPVMLIQILAALLLLLGSGLIIHALVSLDTGARPQARPRRRFDQGTRDACDDALPKAA